MMLTSRLDRSSILLFESVLVVVFSSFRSLRSPWIAAPLSYLVSRFLLYFLSLYTSIPLLHETVCEEIEKRSTSCEKLRSCEFESNVAILEESRFWLEVRDELPFASTGGRIQHFHLLRNLDFSKQRFPSLTILRSVEDRAFYLLELDTKIHKP